MYIVEIIDPEKAELVYNPEVFSTQKEAEDYLKEVWEDTGLEGIVVSVLLEEAFLNNRMILVSADIVYHT